MFRAFTHRTTTAVQTTCTSSTQRGLLAGQNFNFCLQMKVFLLLGCGFAGAPPLLPFSLSRRQRTLTAFVPSGRKNERTQANT